jgi:hypothetical protein
VSVGALRATAAVPMVPVAPGLLSTTTVPPIFSALRRNGAQSCRWSRRRKRHHDGDRFAGPGGQGRGAGQARVML